MFMLFIIIYSIILRIKLLLLLHLGKIREILNAYKLSSRESKNVGYYLN